MIMFQPDYLEELIRVGEADAEARGDELEALVAPDEDDAGQQAAGPDAAAEGARGP